MSETIIVSEEEGSPSVLDFLECFIAISSTMQGRSPRDIATFLYSDLLEAGWTPPPSAVANVFRKESPDG